MKALEESIFLSICVIIFCAAVALMITNVGNLRKANQEMDRMQTDNDIAYVSVEEATEPTVSYAEIMAMLMGDELEYDVYIERVKIEKNTYTPAQLSNYSIPVFAGYKREIVLNPDGSVKYIQFWGV